MIDERCPVYAKRTSHFTTPFEDFSRDCSLILFCCVGFLFRKINDAKFRNAVCVSDMELSEFTEIQELVGISFAHTQYFTELWNRNHIRVLLKKLRKF